MQLSDLALASLMLLMSTPTSVVVLPTRLDNGYPENAD
jgi:hypothetical protein